MLQLISKIDIKFASFMLQKWFRHKNRLELNLQSYCKVKIPMSKPSGSGYAAVLGTRHNMGIILSFDLKLSSIFTTLLLLLLPLR